MMVTVIKATITGEVLRQALPPGGREEFQADLSVGKTNNVIEQHKELFT